MARHPGRDGPAWRRVRAQVLARERVCWICSEPIDFDAPPRSPRSPSVDHVIPLNAMRHLDPGSQRQLALDPANLHAAHYGHNAGRRERKPKVQVTGSRAW